MTKPICPLGYLICVCTETTDGAKIIARKLWRQITVTSLSKLKHVSVYSRTVGVATKITYIYYYTIKRDGAVKYTIFFRCEKCVCEVIISAKTYPHADVKHSFYLCWPYMHYKTRFSYMLFLMCPKKGPPKNITNLYTKYIFLCLIYITSL